MYIKYVFLVLADLVMTVLGLFLAPILVLFATKEAHLPKWLAWFDTPDNTLDGDDGWKNEHLKWLNLRGDVLDTFRIYMKRVFWLWRNTSYGFSNSMLGVYVPKTVEMGVEGNTKVGNRPLSEGKCFAKMSKADGEAFMFYYVKKTFKGRCLRIYLGWKLKNKVDHPEWEGKAMLVFSINPFMGYSEY